MTDKEIIIDGIDVSECNHFKYENVDCVINNTCCWGFDCKYKQLKRKEKECEELKREIAFGNNGKLSDKIRAIVFKNLNNENSKYKQALDEIEEFCEEILANILHYSQGTVITAENINNIIKKIKEGNNAR